MTHAYDDLRHAIESAAFVKRTSGAVIIETEHSGARGDWLFDFRALLLQPTWMDRYADIFWERYANKLPFQVGAMESAGIALVSAIVMKGVARGTPVNGFYIRKSRKRQGLMKQIEGTLTDDPIILVDDLINNGHTMEKQLAVIADTGRRVSDIFVLLRYRSMEAYAHLVQKDIALQALFSLEDFGVPLLKEHRSRETHTFEEMWRYMGPDPSFHLVVQKSAPVIDNELLYLGCDDGTMRALDQATGTLVWEFKIGSHPEGKGILSTPALHNGILYFGAYDGVVYALQSKTGKEVWRYDDADWVGSSPALAPELGVLFIGLEFGLFGKRGGIVALDMKSGKRRWQHKTPSLTHGSPLYIPEERMVVIGSNDGVCYAYDAVSGAEQWRFGTRGDIKTAPAYDPVHKTVFVASHDGTLYGLSAESGQPLAVKETGAAIYSIPLVCDDTVYVASLDKKVYALDTNTLRERWVFATNGRVYGSPIVVEGSVFIGSNDGRLYELDSRTGKLQGYFQASERIMSTIAHNPATQRVFARTVANEVYCLQRSR